MLDLWVFFKYHPESLTSTPCTVGEDVFRGVVAEMCGERTPIGTSKKSERCRASVNVSFNYESLIQNQPNLTKI
jgi:hypothetical protein